jgi:hypothetical protein
LRNLKKGSCDDDEVVSIPPDIEVTDVDILEYE